VLGRVLKAGVAAMEDARMLTTDVHAGLLTSPPVIAAAAVMGPALVG